MRSRQWTALAGAAALAVSLGGCATWNDMNRSEKGTAVGATGGAVVGAAVGGPVGAAVGAGIGGYTGHHQGFGESNAAGSANAAPQAGYDSGMVRSVQSSLDQRGYDVGAIDGQFGPNTEAALRDFQRDNGLAATGAMDARTLDALNVRP
jgi:hypothetical protein